jgi:hypothetical protein
MTKLKTVALNRIIGKVHLDSVTDVKQNSDSARLLFSSEILLNIKKRKIWTEKN